MPDFQEEWKPIVGFDEYEVSNLGNIRRTIRYSVKPYPNRKGYLSLKLSQDGKLKTTKMHTLVALAFLGDRPPGMQINHKDGDKKNNSLLNLEYISGSDNIKHAIALGLYRPNYQLRGTPKLTREQVLEIRQKFGTATLREIGKQYGVSREAIIAIKYGRNWKWLKSASELSVAF